MCFLGCFRKINGCISTWILNMLKILDLDGMNVVCEIRSASGIDSNQHKIRRSCLLSAVVPLMMQGSFCRQTCITSFAMILRCIASLFYEYALVRAAKDQMELSYPPPVPDDMTWHADAMYRATHGAECKVEKSIWMFQSGCRQSHWRSETSLPSKCCCTV